VPLLWLRQHTHIAGAVSPGGTIAALSIAVASANTILLDEANNPLTNIISWLDRLAVGLTAEIRPGFDPAQVHAVTGWPASDSLPRRSTEATLSAPFHLPLEAVQDGLPALALVLD
jgi:sugar (pentulose or hexulose) kinase